MKNEKKLCSVVLVCFVILLTACNNIGNILTGEAQYPADQATSYEKALEVVKEKLDLGKVKIFSLHFMEGEQLSNDLTHILVRMVNQDNFAYDQTFSMDGTVGNMNQYESSIDVINYADIKGIDITKINTKEIEGYITEAKKMLPEKHSFKSIIYYDIEEVLPSSNTQSNKKRNIGSQKTIFRLSFTEDGKEYETSAGVTSIIYYEAEATVNPDGKLSLECK